MLTPDLKIYKFALPHHPGTRRNFCRRQRGLQVGGYVLFLPDDPAKPRNRYYVPGIPREYPRIEIFWKASKKQGLTL
ncbi:hypothetical protein KAX17_03605 [Candidatus Bipolaricaulota bacterium]|nr:hypothetical protein [Candidatus Bipolaricaulota bacterium]